jgi:hypothetical protein
VDRPFWMADMERREEKEKKPVVGRQQARRHAIGSGSTPSSPPPPPPTAAAGTCCVACCSIGASLSMAWHLSPQSPARRMFRAEADGLTVHWPGGRTDGRTFLLCTRPENAPYPFLLKRSKLSWPWAPPATFVCRSSSASVRSRDWR